MTTQKKYSIKPWRELIQFPIVIIAFGILFAIYDERIALKTGVILFILVAFFSVLFSFITIRSYKCPECSQKTNPSSAWWFRYPGKKIFFHCDKCDIDWDFGFRGQED